MKKTKWYLHIKEWHEKGDSRSGANFFVVSPELRISIELKTAVGYLARYQDEETAALKAREEGKKAAEKFQKYGIIGDNVTKRIIGKKILSDPIY